MELTLDQALQKGVEAHKAGKAQEADRYYTAILKANPKHPDANHNMGVLAVGVGKVTEALPFFKTALEVNPKIDQYWLSYIDALIKLDRMADAKAVFGQAKSTGAKGDVFEKIELRLNTSSVEVKNQTLDDTPNPPNILDELKLDKALKLANKKAKDGLSEDAKKIYQDILKKFPKNKRALDGIKILARKTSVNTSDMREPSGDKFQSLVNLYTKEHYQQAINRASKLLEQFPNSINLYNLLGAANKGLGKLEEAIEAYKKAISIKPDYSDAYVNMGNALKEQGKLQEGIEAYNKALSIKPNFAEAHRNLSTVKKYTADDKQFLQVKELFGTVDLEDDARCNLSFALAKMYEGIGELDRAFEHLSEGNALRKKLLNYSIEQDKKLFYYLKKLQPKVLKNSLKVIEASTDITPIFILGMPRSGTTLVEQIISSHSEVLGAGELNYVSQLGLNLAVDPKAINTGAISKFRQMYLSEVSKLSNGKRHITDKMPQNFRFIPLICAALPEAKIIHVKRNAAATCWSNFKQYFPKNGLGYCYDLKDVVDYYKLYNDLTEFWQSQYSDRIYNLNYEDLTTDQENQTRKLIKYLDLNWEASCLSLHENKRSVRTASQQQVRKKVYQGSSEAWRRYEPLLNGAFDSLKPI